MRNKDQFSLTRAILYGIMASGLILASAMTNAPAAQLQTVEQEVPTNRIILKYKPATEAFITPLQAHQMERLNSAAGIHMKYFRAMSGDAHVLTLPERLPLDHVRAICDQLMALPEIEYAEPDQLQFPFLTPNDPQYANQWHYFESWGVNLPAAWDITTGLDSIVMAVIDTGITNHADLSGRTVPGYDFIADVAVANDGDGRDSDPRDPGDWIAANECYSGSPAKNTPRRA